MSKPWRAEASFRRRHIAAAGEPASLAKGDRHRLELRLDDVVRRATGPQAHVDRQVRALRERPHEVLDQPRVERADHLRGDLDLVHDERAPGQVERDLHRGLVERHGDRGEPADARLVAERLGQRLAHREADVLDGVVAVDVQVALARDLEIPAGVLAELLEHVVEERQAGVGRRGPAASRSSSTRTSVSFVVRATIAHAVRSLRAPP